jgi:adenylate cyclase
VPGSAFRPTGTSPAAGLAIVTEPAYRLSVMTDDPIPLPETDAATTEIWRSILTGSDPSLPALRRRFGRIPSEPRCKMCAAPFRGPGRLITRLLMHGPSNANPMLCNVCFGQLREGPGGAEVEISVLFADIRGSTGIAERTSAGEFRRLVQQFYRRASKAIHEHDGIVDKFLGDGIMALFIPVVTGAEHALRAIEAGEAVLRDVMDRDLVAGGIRVGVGVHTGEAFVGTVGSDERLDFTALGDTVNVAARLGSDAGAGELFISDVAWRAAGRGEAAASERRALAVKGRTEPLEVIVLGGEQAAVH